MRNIKYIKANIGQCAGVDGCQFAPTAIIDATPVLADKVSHSIDATTILRGIDALPSLIEFSTALSSAVLETVQAGNFPIVLGGDHSCGIGTWSGVIKSGEDFGLLWIDAHFDMHTMDSSDSKNTHGMPMATLLGNGIDELVNIHSNGKKLKPENVVFIGIRSFENPEQKLAEELGIKIYYADDVNELGFEKCFKDSVKNFQDRNISFGISFDMDSLDVSEMTALGTPVENGLILKDVMYTFNNTDMTGLKALEVVEYNPTLDETGDDVIPVQKILSCFDADIKV